MKATVKIAPSLLSADFLHLAKAVEMAEKGGADMLHLDVMDGHFVPNLTFGPPIITQLKKLSHLPLDIHLMIVNAENTYQAYIDAGADWLSVHVEAVTHSQRLLSEIRRQNIKAGLVLNPATSLSVLEHLLPDLDYVLLMTVNPGFGGQRFIPQMINKITALKQIRDDHSPDSFLIEVDGGVNLQNITEITAAGADILVAGNAVYGVADPQQAIEALRQAAQYGANKRQNPDN
ncbi:MAG TPA: ribulose-phosphate 3-epimerase [Candidatus Marinimicrobia bacterium]|nr:ribulose-phosphate 3-epimerase [Candidatus Neomarinimicrobiota bacterium]